jgi:perosamine synthetase
MTLPSDQDASGRTLGAEELAALARAIESGTLTSTKGTFVKELEQRFAKMIGTKHAFACSSGTAAVHCAVAALDPEPGDEIVTTPITDMGALTPILYQGAIPVFADVDPHTYNVTASTIERCLSERTRAIVVTHLFGNPCDMRDILELARSKNLPIIEDCAQAFGASYGGANVGSFGAVGCFSLQQGKHITTGEGGLVVTSDDRIARRMYLFINKAWGYGDPSPDHYFIALNYRMSELAGAVAVAQLDKLGSIVRRRIELARKLNAMLAGLPGIETPQTYPAGVHTYWKYCVRVDPRVVEGGAVAIAGALREQAIFAVPRYIQKPAFACEIFQRRRTFGRSSYPFTLARPQALDYRPELFLGTYDALDAILVIPWNDRYTDEHVTYIADALHAAANERRAAS